MKDTKRKNIMCLYPKLIKNPKYKPNKKNNWRPPVLKDKRIQYIPIGCKVCSECKGQKAREWQVRLTEEVRNDLKGHFITYSFNPESLEELRREAIINHAIETEGELLEDDYKIDNEAATLGVRRFLERWRKKYGVSVKHWIITELGQTNTERIHLHGIIWRNEGRIKEQHEDLKKIWKYGHVFIGDYVSERTVNYVVKYVSKPDEKHQDYQPVILCSAGLGKGYINRIDARINKYKKEGNTDERYTSRKGYKMALPMYYRNKIYTEEEREKLWIEKIDKDIRWVKGNKIEKSQTPQGKINYYKTLETYREKDKRLGYSTPIWNGEKYEEDRKKLKKIVISDIKQIEYEY